LLQNFVISTNRLTSPADKTKMGFREKRTRFLNVFSRS
jgi:hypothetical protein